MVPLPSLPNVTVSFHDLLVMERNGMKTFPKVVNDKVIDVDVSGLLNGIDLAVTRVRGQSFPAMLQPICLFYSYSHKDEALRNELETHLKLLQRQGWIETWYDRKIEAGTDWKEKIDENLERADIILLLVSADFIASDYCYDKEMNRAMERQRAGKTRVVPVIVRDVNWKSAPFSALQAVPTDGIAVTKWPIRDSAWRNVSEELEKVIQGIQTKLIDDVPAQQKRSASRT